MEEGIKNKLKTYEYSDIYFLKSQWRNWIKKGELHHFEQILGKPNIQSVYKLLDPKAILEVKKARQDFFQARITHSKKFEVIIIFKLTKRIEIITYYKKPKQKQV